MTKHRWLLGTVVLLLPVPRAFADQVVLKNGDRLTGQIRQYEGGTLVLKSELAGEIRMPWTALESLRSADPLSVTLRDDRVVSGTLELQGGTLAIRPEGAEPARVAADTVIAIRSIPDQATYVARREREQNPGLRDFWSGSLDAALSTARGNAETLAVNVGAGAVRATQHDRVSLVFASLLSRSTLAGRTETTANALRAGTRYERNLRERLFWFGLADFEYDRLQGLDFRQVAGGGLGFQLKKTARADLQVFGGGSSNREVFRDAPNRISGEALLGEDGALKISDRITATERLVIYPNLTTGGEYRVSFDSTVTTRFSTWLGWHVTTSYRFLSNPTPGKKQGDLLLATGLRVTFGEKRDFKARSGVVR